MWFERLLIVFNFLRQRLRPAFRTRSKLEKWQRTRLKKHLKFLRAHSAFYRERLRDPWSETEPVDKATMMTNFDRLNTRGLQRDQVMNVALQSETSRNFRPMVGDVTVGLSSGTSGHRGLFCADRRERLSYAGTILAKALPKGSLFKRHRVAFFLRANSNLYETVRSRRLEFHYFDLLKPFAEHVARLREVQPTLLIGPPSLLRLLAEEILAGHLRVEEVERVYSVAEVLDPVDERRIQAAFQQKVHQIYQCTEGFLGISCEHGSLHLNEDLLIFEKEWVDFENGKFVPILTDLQRRTQPIVRYRLNDILTEDREPCPCGSVHTRLKMIEGRCDDMLEFKSGEGWQAVFPDFVRNAILFASDDILEYRVVQAPNRDMVVALRSQKPIAQVEELVEKQLQRLADKLSCELPPLKFEHEFPPLNGRKLRRVIRQA